MLHSQLQNYTPPAVPPPWHHTLIFTYYSPCAQKEDKTFKAKLKYNAESMSNDFNEAPLNMLSQLKPHGLSVFLSQNHVNTRFIFMMIII